jgi:hypothetical protein
METPIKDRLAEAVGPFGAGIAYQERESLFLAGVIEALAPIGLDASSMGSKPESDLVRVAKLILREGRSLWNMSDVELPYGVKLVTKWRKCSCTCCQPSVNEPAGIESPYCGVEFHSLFEAAEGSI